MLERVVASALMCTLGCVTVQGQARAPHPPVTKVFEDLDADQDGLLSSKEVAGSRYARQFPRWDVDQSGTVDAKEVIAFRRKFGIAADGSLLRQANSFFIPSVDQLPRVGPGDRVSVDALRQSAYIIKTVDHAPTGEQYFVLTDHTNSAYLNPLQQLVEHYRGTLLQVSDLSRLMVNHAEWEGLRTELKSAKYVAIAPRKDTFTENTLLNMWALLSSIDDDELIDVWPGLLLASNEDSFERLIKQSINRTQIGIDAIRPIAISQVQRASETRSLQKAGVLRRLLSTNDMKVPVVAVYGPTAGSAPRLKGEKIWNLTLEDDGGFLKAFPAAVDRELESANLWVLHGHGIPGMACSIDVDGLPDDLEGKVVMSGSCFSACPWESDLPPMREAPGGYTVEQQRDSFSIAAVDRGAIISFGHQRLSSGFPHLFPVMESLVSGKPAGQAYQELLNALMGLKGYGSTDLVLTAEDRENKRPRQNSLLYVMIGDPAIHLRKSEENK